MAAVRELPANNENAVVCSHDELDLLLQVMSLILRDEGCDIPKTVVGGGRCMRWCGAGLMAGQLSPNVQGGSTRVNEIPPMDVLKVPLIQIDDTMCNPCPSHV